MNLAKAVFACGVFSIRLSAQQPQGPLTDQRIMTLVMAGVSPSEVFRIIATAPEISFDLRPIATDAMMNVGVSPQMIKAMAAREIGAALPTAGAAPTSALARSDYSPATPPAAVPRMATAISRPTLPVGGSYLVLHEGTPLRMRIMRTVSSADAQVGNNIDFKTLDEVVLGGGIVIPRGATAIATITVAESKKRMARGGKLGMNIDYVRLPNGDELPLRGVQSLKGGGHTGAMTGAMVATAIVFWPAAPFFLFMHGKDVTIPEGHEVTVYTNADYTFSATDTSAAVR
jgi:hypothetical protein